MPDLRRRKCKLCGKTDAEGGPLTWNGMHVHCAYKRQVEHNKQLEAHAGPHFQAWRRATAASVGAVLLDDLPGGS